MTIGALTPLRQKDLATDGIAQSEGHAFTAERLEIVIAALERRPGGSGGDVLTVYADFNVRPKSGGQQTHEEIRPPAQ
jgi:hypothetical protein